MRSYYLQGIKGDHFGEISESNVLHGRVLNGARGVITDHEGKVLATNRPSFDLTFLAKGVPRQEFERIAVVLGDITFQPPETILKSMLKARKRPLSPRALAKNVSDKVLAYVSEHRLDLQGVLIEDQAMRFYPMGRAAAHLMGYLGEVSIGEIEENRFYAMGDFKGRAGIEASYENYLAGTKGYEKVWLDALGQKVKQKTLAVPNSGAKVVLTIDADLQKIVHEAFEGKRGALVAIEPSTGRILSLYSAPAYDPNVFVRPETSKKRMELFSDTELPLYNRALQATYSPGSTFKLVTMLAGLASKKLKPRTSFRCTGSYAGMKCWKEKGHGWVRLASAFRQSCNVYFYRAGEKIWIDPIRSAADKMGLVQKSGIALGDESVGVVPDAEWERQHVKGPDGQHWGAGDVRNTAIGQGYVSVTPMQMARVVAAAVFGGKRMKSVIIDRIETSDGRIPFQMMPQVEADMNLSDETAAFVRYAMSEVVSRGTGRRAQVKGITVGGKTGTAQNPQGADHAWFIGGAPTENPQIALCVLVEHAGQGGGTAAAPIAAKVFEAYSKKNGWRLN